MARTGFLGTGRLALGVAVFAIAVVAFIVAVNPTRLQPGVGQPTASSSATPLQTASGSAAPPAAVVLGSSGSAVVVRVTGDRLDVLEWKPDGTWRPIGAIPSLAASLGDWAFDGYYDIAVSDDGHVALPVARGPDGGQTTRLAIFDLARPTAPPVLIDAGDPAFLGDGTLVVLSAVEDQTVLRYSPPYSASIGRTVVPADVQIHGPTGNVTTPLSILADESGLYGLRAQPGATFTNRPRELVAVGWDGSVRAADASVEPALGTGADRLVDALGRSSFVQDPHEAPKPAFVVQAPGGDPVVVASGTVSANAWRPGGHELAYIEDGALQIWDGSTSKTIDTLPTPADGTFISGFSEHGVFVVFEGTTWRISFGECLHCGSVGGHLDGHVARVLP